MSSTSNDNSGSARVSPRSGATSLCFRAPGGRIGLPRLSGVAELLKVADNVSVMLTRRQALVVRGSFNNIPEYLHEELESYDISAPNIKSYPIPTSENASTPLVRSFENKLADENLSPTISYSSTDRFRNELIRDDFCVIRRNDHSLKVTSTRWTKEPTTLVDSVSVERWPGIVDGLKQCLVDRSDEGHSVRTVKRILTKSINNAETREATFGANEWIHEGKIIQSKPTNDSRFPAMQDDARGKYWLLVTVPAGHLSPDDLETILETARAVPVNELRLTPEQNLVLPVPEDDLLTIRKTLSKELNDKLVGTPFRVSTCPGSQFCANAKYDSVKLARQLYEPCANHPELASFNANHPIVIASCGDTQDLERRHDVALVPSSNPSRVDIYMGGSPHGLSEPGIIVKRGVPRNHIAEELLELVNNFIDASHQTLRTWAENNRAD